MQVFRAIAYSSDPSWRGLKAYERIVFLEADNLYHAQMIITGLLASVWSVAAESIEFYNLKSESELVAESVGGDETGDHRLLEMGVSQGHPVYGESKDHPLFLLDEHLNRMMTSYLTLPHYGAMGVRVAKGLFGQEC